MGIEIGVAGLGLTPGGKLIQIWCKTEYCPTRFVNHSKPENVFPEREIAKRRLTRVPK